MKKFLSLALALVMTMSLVTIGAGAKEFTDDSKITYAEAVAVISEAGIIDGYTDGSFNPTGTLTRGAAAKIICNMILGPTTASALSADAAPFKDVPANHVFAGYIAYCAQQGIINGYADGTFKPAGTLTGYQFMKMLLGALGYEGKYEGFTGANWSINVAKLALHIGLDDGNDEFVGTKAVTREEACLYAFNTLKADMVEYADNTQITVGDVVINTSSKADTVYNAPKNDYLGRTDAENGDKAMQFIEKYFEDLTASKTSKKDAFGRPAIEWYNDGEKFGTYAETADDSIIVDETTKTVYDILTGVDYLNLDYTDDLASKVAVYVNGKQQDKNNVKDDLDLIALNAGDKVETFENDDNDVYVVVVTRYEVAKIDAVEDELPNADTKKGASYAIDLKNLDAKFPTTATTSLYDKHDDSTKAELKGFNAETYVKNAVLAVVPGALDVLASNIADTAEGQISAVKTGNKATITLGGTKYPVVGGIQKALESIDFDYDDSEYTLYLDPNGYVIGLEGDTNVDLSDVYYLTATGVDTDKFNNDTVIYQGVNIVTGEIKEFAMGDAKDAGKDETVTPTLKKLYSFNEDDGDFFAVEYKGTADLTVKYSETNGQMAPEKVGVSKDDTKATLAGVKVYFDDETTFQKVTNKTKGDVSVKTSTGSVSLAVDSANVVVIYSKSGTTKTAECVVFEAADLGAYLEGSDVIYFKDNSTTSNADGKVIDAYFMDGTGNIESITYNSKKWTSTTKGSFFKFAIDDDGIYELKTGVTEYTTGDYSKLAASAQTGAVSNGWLTNLHNGALSLTSKDYKFVADDIDLSSKVIIIDERDADVRADDLVTYEINNATRLGNAIDKKGVAVNATVFLDDEEVILVAVKGLCAVPEVEG